MLQDKIQQALQNAKKRSEGEGGFTLIELLVVILIIGILAAIALPTFLGQSDKAKDSGAKSNARNVVSMIESCYSTTQDYSDCATKDALSGGTTPDTGGIDGLIDGPAVPDKEEVAVANATSSTYTIVAKSSSDKNFFVINKGTAGTTRSCGETFAAAGDLAATGDSGGACNVNKW